nr:unnamed protein product [Callosobruchus chinensis]
MVTHFGGPKDIAIADLIARVIEWEFIVLESRFLKIVVLMKFPDRSFDVTKPHRYKDGSKESLKEAQTTK